MRRLLGWLLLLSLFGAACSAPPAPGAQSRVLVVFAAASLTEAFTELEASFEDSYPSVDVRMNFGGSQTLRTQVEAGAPADVFASANLEEMEVLEGKHLVEAGTFSVFVTNRLVVIVPASNPAGLQELGDLAHPGIKIVLAAQDVPVGQYSRRALALMDAQYGSGYSGRVLSNVVSYEDNVRQVATKVQLGEADAGMVYASDAVAMKNVHEIPIRTALNVVARYPIAVIADSNEPELGRQFVALVLSPVGQAILRKWGFGPAE